MSTFDELIAHIKQQNPHQPEYLQAIAEISHSIVPIYNANQDHKDNNVLQRLCEPNRIISFKVEWENDDGEVEVNKGWRVQHSNLMGPYKGGLRFHPSVNESILKFLAFEQTFKNALTGLSLGGAKGGANFNPKGRSDNEIRRFCKAFMTQLQAYIGPRVDVPAGDINVSSKEIGYLYGQYKRMTNEFDGTLTGKPILLGGSHGRTEATGYGIVYFLNAILAEHDDTLESKRIAVSGAGNVALYTAEKAITEEAIVITLSNSRGYLYTASGLLSTDINWLVNEGSKLDNSLQALAKKQGYEYIANKKPWEQACDIAIPCATQNELDEEDAQALLKSQCKIVIEGANMPSTEKAIQTIVASNMVYAPSKAANAGGVAVSSLEMSQNANFSTRDAADIFVQLKEIMESIHQICVDNGRSDGSIDYAKGANIGAYRRLADAMIMQGV